MSELSSALERKKNGFIDSNLNLFYPIIRIFEPNSLF
jgi:hypothetical protein